MLPPLLPAAAAAAQAEAVAADPLHVANVGDLVLASSRDTHQDFAEYCTFAKHCTSAKLRTDA